MSNMVRRLLLIVPFILSIGIPYIMLGEATKSTRETIKSWFAKSGSSSSAVAGALANGDGQSLKSASGVIQQPPVTDLSQVLSFQITPQWVLSRWPQVTTTRANGNLEGLRVALVTGTRPQDIAGALTYYFDKQRRLQRIALRGITGDQRYLVSLVTRYYHLQREPVPGVEMYVSRWNGKPISALIVRRKPLVHASDMLDRCEVALELNRPDNYVQLSPGLQKALAAAAGKLPPATPPVKTAAKTNKKATFQTIPGGGIGTLFSGY